MISDVQHVQIVVFAISLVVAVAAALYLYARKHNKLSGVPGGVTAFAKIADADIKAKEAEGKVIAVRAAASAKKEVAAALKEAALDAHSELDQAHEALDEVHNILG